MSAERWALLIGGLLLTVMGVVWALQGAGFLQGSVMSNDGRWTAIGTVVAILGSTVVYQTVTRPS